MKIYIIASSRRAAEEYCQEQGLNPRGKAVCILTREDQARGIQLQSEDGWEYVWRQGDRADSRLFEVWALLILMEAGR